MKKFKKPIQKVVLLMIAFMLLTLPSINAYSSVGDYNSSSLNNSHPSGENKAKIAWYGAVAGAIGISYAAGYAIGTLARHVYDYFGDSKMGYLEYANYDSTDFSQFDN
jgi:hypothetical protein